MSLYRTIPEYAIVAPQSDTVDMRQTCLLYVGGDGNVKVTTKGGDDVTFNGMSAGDFLPVAIVRVWSTGTTATNLVVMW